MDEQEFREALDKSNSRIGRNEEVIRAMAAHIGMDVDQLIRTGKPWPEVCKTVWNKFFLTVSSEAAAAIITPVLAELQSDESE